MALEDGASGCVQKSVWTDIVRFLVGVEVCYTGCRSDSTGRSADDPCNHIEDCQRSVSTTSMERHRVSRHDKEKLLDRADDAGNIKGKE